MTLSSEQVRALDAIERCRTAALGGHLDVCVECGFERPAYNSCRNRHCPKCQNVAAAKWLAKRSERMLPVGHFHLVFTLPSRLRGLARYRPAQIFQLLLQASAETLLESTARRLSATIGFTSILHTWTRELAFHPHAHVIATSGGLSRDGKKWVSAGSFLVSIHVLSALFRGKFMDGLKTLYRKGFFEGFDEFQDPAGFDALCASLYATKWNTYAKAPLASPTATMKYLARYTHRVGISNQRILSVDDSDVTFLTKGGKTKTLRGVEFLKRFLEHILPKRFTKIRHYGLYASSHAEKSLAVARKLLPPDTRVVKEPVAQVDELRQCPQCKSSVLTTIPVPQQWKAPPTRGPPEQHPYGEALG